ncbi:MAG: flagellar biosynthetic protein FliO [Ignavibacteriota bacterium]
MEGFQQILGVMVVFGLLAATLWWARRRGLAQVPALAQRRKVRILQIVDRVSLAPAHSLHLIRMADRAILLTVSPSGCQVLESSPWASIEGHIPEDRQ